MFRRATPFDWVTPDTWIAQEIFGPVLSLQVGQLAINTLWSGGVIGAPFGGYKSSGFGRNVSAESMLDDTQTKTVIIDATV